MQYALIITTSFKNITENGEYKTIEKMSWIQSYISDSTFIQYVNDEIIFCLLNFNIL